MTAALAAALMAVTPVAAREHVPNRVAVAVGATVAPDYEGSDDMIVAVASGALVRVAGRSLVWKGNGLAIDLVPEYRDQTFKIVAGPVASLNFDLAVTPHDPVVAQTRKRKVALEGGGYIGFAKTGLITSAYDTLAVTVTAAHDMGNVHKSLIVTPSVSYSTPLSHSVMVELNLSADIVGGRYARYYFGVGSGSATRSGLPRYTPGWGLKSVSVGLGAGVALNGDLDRRGFIVGGAVNYERLLGQFAASPIVAQRGSPNQATLTVGMGYRF